MKVLIDPLHVDSARFNAQLSYVLNIWCIFNKLDLGHIKDSSTHFPWLPYHLFQPKNHNNTDTSVPVCIRSLCMQHLVQFSDDTFHIPTSMLWHESEDCLHIACVQQSKWNILKSFFVDTQCLFYVFMLKKWLFKLSNLWRVCQWKPCMTLFNMSFQLKLHNMTFKNSYCTGLYKVSKSYKYICWIITLLNEVHHHPICQCLKILVSL